MRLWEWEVSHFSFLGWLQNCKETLSVRTVYEYMQLARMALRVLGVALLFHLAMVNVERYIAIKHSLRYETLVTETRLIVDHNNFFTVYRACR